MRIGLNSFLPTISTRSIVRAMTRALITGANGFVGQHLVRYLQQATTWELWALGREAHPQLPTVLADLLDRSAVATAVANAAPDVVVHLAAQSAIPQSFRDPAGTFNINVLGQLHLFEAIKSAHLDPIVLVVGSNAMYGMAHRSGLPADENTMLCPADPYAVSKAAQDLLAGQWWYSHGLKVIRARPFNHTGPGQRADFVVPAFAHQIARIEAGLQPPVIQVGNLTPQRDFSDVRDVVRAYHLLLERAQPGEIYNIGVGQSVSIQSILDRLIALSGQTITVEVDPQRLRPVDVPIVACDASRLRSQIGWEPQYRLDDTLRDILHEWRSHVATELERVGSHINE